jgi:hypothetical protein
MLRFDGPAGELDGVGVSTASTIDIAADEGGGEAADGGGGVAECMKEALSASECILARFAGGGMSSSFIGGG